MQVSDIHIHPVSVPRVYNTGVAAGGPPGGKDYSHYYLLECETATGLRGLGEISDIEESWTVPAPELLRQTLLAPLAGADVRQRLPTWERVDEVLPTNNHPEFHNLVSSAVDTALLDLAGKYYNAPVHALLGGQYRDQLAISWVAHIRNAEELAEEIQEKVDAGFTAFKLKVGADFELDCERTCVFRRIAGPDAYLKTDASGAWSEEKAIDRIRELSALARVPDAVPADIIEDVADFDDTFALALLRHKAVDVFNIVPVQAGSLHRAQRLIQIAEAGGIPVLLGSTFELGHWHRRRTASRHCIQRRHRLLGSGRPRTLAQRCNRTPPNLPKRPPARATRHRLGSRPGPHPRRKIPQAMSMRIGTAQPAQRPIDFNIRGSAKILAAVESKVGTIVAAEPRQSTNRRHLRRDDPILRWRANGRRETISGDRCIIKGRQNCGNRRGLNKTARRIPRFVDRPGRRRAH